MIHCPQCKSENPGDFKLKVWFSLFVVDENDTIMQVNVFGEGAVSNLQRDHWPHAYLVLGASFPSSIKP